MGQAASESRLLCCVSSKKLETPHKLFNVHMTAKGLFRVLQKAPDIIHVLEDCEQIARDRIVQGLLRSALWALPGHDRVLTWASERGEERFSFRGGIILLANRPLADLPELRALATRITVHRLEVKDDELVALVRDLATQGFSENGKNLLEPAQCQQVAEHVIRECLSADCPLDLRLLENAYKDFLFWETDRGGCSWEDLVSARVRAAAHHFRSDPTLLSREERLAQRRQVVRDILGQTADTEEQIRVYKERTGRSRADYFRRKREVQSREFEGEGEGQAGAA